MHSSFPEIKHKVPSSKKPDIAQASSAKNKPEKSSFLLLLLVLLLLLCLSLYWGERIYWLFTVFVFSCIAVSFLYVLVIRLCLRPLYKPSFMTVNSGDNISIPLKIKTLLPLLWGAVTVYYNNPYRPDELLHTVFDVSRKRNQNYFINIQSLYKGHYQAYATKIVLSDPFKIFHWNIPLTKNLAKQKPNLLVLPRVYPVTVSMPLPKGMQDYNQQAFLNKDEDSTVCENRMYIHGDPLKRVNWKVSARMHKLFVKKPDMDQASELYLYLDAVQTQKDELLIDQCLCEAAASCANYYLQHGLGGIKIRSYKKFSSEFYGGHAAIYAILSHMAKVSGITPLKNEAEQRKQLHAMTLLGASSIIVLEGAVSVETAKVLGALPAGSILILISAGTYPDYIKNFEQSGIKVFFIDPYQPIKNILSGEAKHVQARH